MGDTNRQEACHPDSSTNVGLAWEVVHIGKDGEGGGREDVTTRHRISSAAVGAQS